MRVPPFRIFTTFLRLGLTGFGGPLALAAQMQHDLVEKERWIEPAEFQKAFPLIKSMPGAVAFSTAMYLGRRAGGRWGGLLAGLGLVLPAFFMMIALAAYFTGQRERPGWMEGALNGMQASALALILLALRSLVQPYLKETTFWILAALAAVIFYFDWLPEPVMILSFGGLWILLRSGRHLMGGAGVVVASDPEFFKNLSWVCFKAGAFVFGSGIAIAPLLEKDFVDRFGWVTRPEFLNALAWGQVTPGPVMITVTYLGYELSGWTGALAATTAIFLPSFIHMMTWFPAAVDVLSRQRWIEHFIFGALAAVAGTIVVTVFKLGSDFNGPLILWTVLATFLGLKLRMPSWLWILVGAGLFASGALLGAW